MTWEPRGRDYSGLGMGDRAGGRETHDTVSDVSCHSEAQ